jgi:hypothetical protein
MPESMRDRVSRIYHDSFGIDFLDYLNGRGKEFAVAVQNSHTSTYEWLDADLGAEALSFINANRVDSKAGLITKKQWQECKQKDYGDVLMLASTLLDDSDLCLDAMIFHELCHLVIDGEITIPDAASEDKLLGKMLHNRSDIANENQTRHDLEFCEIMAQGARGLWPHGYSDAWDVIQYAMRFDIFELPRCKNETEALESAMSKRNEMQDIISALFQLLNNNRNNLNSKSINQLSDLTSRWVALNSLT